MLIVMHIAVLQPLTSFGLMFLLRYTVTALCVVASLPKTSDDWFLTLTGYAMSVLRSPQTLSKWSFELDVKFNGDFSVVKCVKLHAIFS